MKVSRYAFGCLIGALLSCSALIWLVFFSTIPASKVAQVSVQGADGRVYVLTLWQARPLVPLPFLDTPHAYVQFGEDRFFVHGRSFGWAMGDVLVSPDHTQVIVTRRFEGGERAYMLISLAKGRRKRIKGWSADYRNAGWKELPWEWDN